MEEHSAQRKARRLVVPKAVLTAQRSAEMSAAGKGLRLVDWMVAWTAPRSVQPSDMTKVSLWALNLVECLGQPKAPWKVYLLADLRVSQLADMTACK